MDFTAAVLLALKLLSLDPTAVNVTVVEHALPGMSYSQQQAVNAWVTDEHRGMVFIAGWSSLYKGAVNGKQTDLVRLAAVIAHEQCHLNQVDGYRETPCYDVQIETLRRLGAPRHVIWNIEDVRDVFARAEAN